VRLFLARQRDASVLQHRLHAMHSVLRNALEHTMREDLVLRNVTRLVRVPTRARRNFEPWTIKETLLFLANPATRTEVVPVEERHTERAFVAPDREPYELERREADLVHRYRNHLLRRGHNVSRLRVVPAGESAPLYSDLWDETAHELVEAKGGVTREQIRTGVGQLLDYGRFIDAKTRTLLVPARPRQDLLDLLKTVGIGLVYPDGDQWHRIK
jgi:hypothetical protein